MTRTEIAVRIEIDRESCVGAGMCVLAAEDVFDQDAVDGRVLMRVQELKPDQVDAAGTAVGLCPSGALSLRSEKV